MISWSECVLFLVLRIKLELNRCRMIPLLSTTTEVLSHRNKLLNRNSKNFQLPLACRNSNLIKTTNLSRYSLNRIYLTPIKILIKINKWSKSSWLSLNRLSLKIQQLLRRRCRASSAKLTSLKQDSRCRLSSRWTPSKVVPIHLLITLLRKWLHSNNRQKARKSAYKRKLSRVFCLLWTTVRAKRIIESTHWYLT